MRIFAIVLACLVAAVTDVSGQLQFNITGVNASSFPRIGVGFDAKDNAGVNIRNFNPSDFTVMEDGIQRQVLSVSCPPPRTPPVSITLTIDISYSMSLAGRLNNAKVAASQMVRSLSYPPAATGIVTFDDTSYIYLPYTSDSTQILNAINNLQATGGGTDFLGAFLDRITGAIDVTKDRVGDKYIIFLTDGVQTLSTAVEQQIIAAANSAGIRIYSLTLTQGTINFSLRRITTGTGGRWYENIVTQQAAEAAFQEIIQRVYFYDPCELVYETTGCETSRIVDVTLRKNNSTVTRSQAFQINPGLILTLDASTVFTDFGVIPAGSSRTADVTLTAQNGSILVQSLTSSVGAFQIVSFGGSNPPFTLAQGQSRTIRVQFTASDTNRIVTALNIQSNAHCQELVVFAGGAYHPDALTLVQPNGGEVLFSGSNYQVKWKGVPPSQQVALEYSTNAGSSWFLISPNAFSLSVNWTVPNTPSTTCLGLVRTPEVRTTGKDLNWLPTQPSEVFDVAFAPSGTVLAAALNDGRVKMYYPETGVLVDILSGHTGRVNAVTFSPDSKWLVSAGNDGRVRIWSTATGALSYDFAAFTGQVHSVVFSRDGSLLAAADQTRIIVWRTSDWNQEWNRAGNTSAAGALIFEPKNAWLASASGNQVAIVRRSDGGLLRNLAGHGGPVRSLAVSNDGTVLASGSDDRTVILWDVINWAQIKTLSGHTNGVTSVNLSSAGLYVVTSSRDRSVRVWDARSGNVTQTLTGHTSDVNAARFETRLGLIASGGSDRTLRVWGYAAPRADLSDSLWSIIAPSTALDVDGPIFDSLICPGAFSDGVIHIKNTGNQPVTISDAVITGPNASSYTLQPGSIIPPARILQPEDSIALVLRFFPLSTGDHFATLSLTTNAPGIPKLDIPLSGHKDSVALSFIPDSLHYGELYTCTLPGFMTVLIQNTGTVDARLDSIRFTGNAFVQLFGIPRTVPPGAIDTVFVEVRPPAFGSFSGRVEFETTPCNARSSLFITGALTQATPVAVPASVQFPYTSVGDTSVQTFTLSNPTASVMSINILRLNHPAFRITSPAFPTTIPPRDSIVVTVSFEPTSEGDAAAQSLFESTSPCPDSVVVLLNASSSRKPGIATTGGTFGRLLCPSERFIDSVITIHNTGGEPLVISSYPIGGTHASDFSIVTPPQTTIQPGQFTQVVIRFSPLGTGVRTATLTINSNASGQPAHVVGLSGRKDSVGYAVDPPAFALGTLYHCDVPAARSVQLRNTGTVDITITLNTATVPSHTRIDTTLFPLQIAPGVSTSIPISLLPVMLGNFNASLAFNGEPCSLPSSLDLSGSYRDSRPTLSTSLLDFGTTGAGISVTRSLTITNPTGDSMRLSALVLLPSSGFLTRIQPPSLPLMILPGASADVRYEYTPATADTLAGNLLIITNRPCMDTMVVQLRGESRSAFTDVALADLSAQIGDRIRIPVTMTRSANLAVNGTRSFKAQIVFNRSMLWPERVMTTNGSSSFTTQAEGDNVRILMTVDQTAVPNNGILAELECLVLLGNAEQTPLRFDSLAWLNGSADVTLKSGSFTALGICDAGGKRLVALPDAVTLFQNTPNPFNPVTTITFSVPEEMFVDLRVYTTLGREVAVLYQNLAGKGSHTVQFRGDEHSSGMYMCILRSRDTIRTIKMVQLK